MNRSYQRCTRCVMDTSAADIRFDANGICSYCSDFLVHGKQLFERPAKYKHQELDRILAEIKRDGRGKDYDCVIGISGGVDSSWLLVQAVRRGLRPLAVHMDNGWNTELAQSNIANLVRTLGVDLYTYVIDWEEYRSLMQAFFDADVIDVELLYDNAMLAVNHSAAVRHRLGYVLAGYNSASEGMRIPVQWNWFKYDKKNIINIGNRFGKVTLKSFPAIGTLGFMYNVYIRRVAWIPLLEYVEYNKVRAIEELVGGFGYKPYPYKHYESVFTRFYQGFILPQKFSIDKRKLHLATLIMSNQMSRDEALAILEGSPYVSEELLEADKQYFIKKMGWTMRQLEDYIARPEKPHDLYGSEKKLWDFLLVDGERRWAYRAVWRSLVVAKSIVTGKAFARKKIPRGLASPEVEPVDAL